MPAAPDAPDIGSLTNSFVTVLTVFYRFNVIRWNQNFSIQHALLVTG